MSLKSQGFFEGFPLSYFFILIDTERNVQTWEDDYAYSVQTRDWAKLVLAIFKDY